MRRCAIYVVAISLIVPAAIALFGLGQFWAPLYAAMPIGFVVAIVLYLRTIRLHPRPSSESDTSVLGDRHLRRDLRALSWPAWLIPCRWVYVLVCVAFSIATTQG